MESFHLPWIFIGIILFMYIVAYKEAPQGFVAKPDDAPCLRGHTVERRQIGMDRPIPRQSAMLQHYSVHKF